MTKIKKTKIALVTALAALMLLMSMCPILLTWAGDNGQFGVNLAYGGQAECITSLRTKANGGDHARATDGDHGSVWKSENVENPWIYLDLGATEKFKKVIVSWGSSMASKYALQTSNDAMMWYDVSQVSCTQSDSRKHTFEFDNYLEARFIRVYVLYKEQPSVSITEIEVYGPKSLSSNATVVSSSLNVDEANLVDADATTMWKSNVEDKQYVIFDLKNEVSFDNVKIRWGLCFARRFAIYVANENLAREDENWTLVAKSDAGLGETDDMHFAQVSARYIKLELIQRETNERWKGNTSFHSDGYAKWHNYKLYPWQQAFEIFSFDVFDWDKINAVPVGKIMEFAKNAPAWSHMSNITLNPSGLVLAPIGYPIEFKQFTDQQVMDGQNLKGFESYATYNPAVIVDENGRFHMIYRSELPDNFDTYSGSQNGKGHMSTLSYAYSDDGVNFVRGRNNPIKTPSVDEEKWGGTEDPRIFKVRDQFTGEFTYYITYTMYSYSSGVREGMIKTKDFVTFEELGNFAPNVQGRSLKSGTYVVNPEGEAVLMDDPRPGKSGKVYYCIMKDGGVTAIGFTTNVEHINAEDIIICDNAGFGSASIASYTYGNESCVAVTNIYGEDDQDIVLMYGGTNLSDASIKNQQPNSTNWFYALGLAKITKANPFEISRMDEDLVEPFMYPTDTNKIDSGLFVKCMFADTVLRHNDKWYFYYGAGDMYVGLATSEASFSANACDFTLDGNVITASTLALNKKYNQDVSPIDVKLVANVYDVNGELISSQIIDFSVKHFSLSDKGVYYTGDNLSMDIDVSNLPSQYYVTCYLIDGNGKILNNPSTYVKVNAEVTFGD